MRPDRALYGYTAALKAHYIRNTEALSKVAYDNRLQAVQHARCTHTMVSRVQGTRLKARREIRLASLFKQRA